MRHLTIPTFVAAATLLLPTLTHADPQVAYHVTGDFNLASIGTPRLEDTSFIIRLADGGSTNGSMDLATSPIDQTRVEIFSDPNLTPSPILYENLRTFAYFGLLTVYDASGNPAGPSQVFVASQPLPPAVVPTFNFYFADFMATHPQITGPADLVTVLQQGPDFPAPGANQLWIDFNAYITDHGSPYHGDIHTDFQTGDSLLLVTFDNATGNAATFGTLRVEALRIPEPASLSLLTLLLPLATRKRSA